MRLQFEDFELDPEALELRKGGERVSTQTLVFRLLAYLARHPDRVVSKDELLREVWQGATVSEWAISRALREARRAVGDSGSEQRIIETVRGLGYRFVASVASSATRAPSTLVGRAPVLHQLKEILDELRAGGAGRLVLISGEPGIGKTRLLEELIVGARERGFAVWQGRCSEAGAAGPYAPWVQLLDAGLASEKAPADALSNDGLAALREAMPELEERLPTPSSAPRFVTASEAQGRFRLASHLASLLAAAHRGGPLLLAIDDLLRADPASFALFEEISARAVGLEILLVGTFRDTELEPGTEKADAMARLARLGRALSIPLEGLVPVDIQALAASASATPLSRARADAIRDHTRGNPFFVLQILQSSTRLDPSDPALPKVVRDAVLHHLSSLSEDCRSLLRSAATIGRDFDVPTLARAARFDSARVDELLEEATRARVLESDPASLGSLRFAHALIADALVASLSEVLRRAEHRKVGEALLGGPTKGRASDIAHHFLRAASAHASADDWERAIEYSILASREASTRQAHLDAAEHLERALDLARRVGARSVFDSIDLLLELGENQVRAHRFGEAHPTLLEAARRARERGDPIAAGRAALAIAQLPYKVGDETTSAPLRKVLESVPVKETRLRCQLKIAFSNEVYFVDDVEAETVSREAVSMARELGDPQLLCDALMILGIAISTPERIEEREDLSDEHLRLALELGDARRVYLARTNRMSHLLEVGDLAAVGAEITAHARLTREHANLLFEWHDAHFRSLQHYLDERYEEAEAAARDAYELGIKTGYPVAHHWYGTQVFAICLRKGGLPGHQELFDRLLEGGHLGWQLASAFAALERGDSSKARPLVRRVVVDGQVRIRRDFCWISSVALTADLAVALGDTATAKICARELLPFYDRRASLAGYTDFGTVASRLGDPAG